MKRTLNSSEQLHALLLLTLSRANCGLALPLVAALNQQQRIDFLALANSNHVVIRAFEVLHDAFKLTSYAELACWIRGVLRSESVRVSTALQFLDSICRELESEGCPVTVLKSLDHIPDLGSDLDLYTIADKQAVTNVMIHKFNARQEPRSAGDRLANKWNFIVPGLPEPVEVHVQRLGQAGEHTSLARRFVTRRVRKIIGPYDFPVPAPEEVVLAATFQRMYRHFFLRVCDIVNTIDIIEGHTLDYAALQAIATSGSVWPGVATYLKIMSDYATQYRNYAVDVPHWVTSSSLFGAEKVFCHNSFLRIPILFDAARLYTSQWTKTMLDGNLAAAMRLSVLPALFSVAAVHYKITGRDQGVW